jgi:hypothetical protein
MSDLSTAAQSAINSLAAATAGGFVEEYQVGNGIRRVRRGSPTDQVNAALKLEAVSARRSSGLFNLSKFREDRS